VVQPARIVQTGWALTEKIFKIDSFSTEKKSPPSPKKILGIQRC